MCLGCRDEESAVWGRHVDVTVDAGLGTEILAQIPITDIYIYIYIYGCDYEGVIESQTDPYMDPYTDPYRVTR